MNKSRKEEGTRANPDPIEIEIENAKQRIANQRETFRDFSNQGMRMFRLLLLFVAAPTAILGGFAPDTLGQLSQVLLSSSCAIESGGVCLEIGGLTILTSFFFLVAAALNISAVGFDARGTHDLVNPEDIVETVKNDQTYFDYQRQRLVDLSERIDHNNQVISVKESWLAWGKVILFLSVFGIATLSYILLSGNSISLIVWLIVFILYGLLLVVHFERVPDSFMEADRSLRPEPLYNRDEVIEFTSEWNEDKPKEPSGDGDKDGSTTED